MPKGIGDDYLKISATFRDGARFPILSYYHAETKVQNLHIKFCISKTLVMHSEMWPTIDRTDK